VARTTRYIAVALFAALAIAVFLLVQHAPDTQSLMAADIETLRTTKGDAPQIVSRAEILRTRGSAVDAEIPLPAAGEAIEVRVLPEFAARPARYRVRLFRMSDDDSLQNVAELSGLAPAPDYFVTFYIEGALLRPGQYRLAITGDPDTDARDKESAFMLRMVNDPSAASR
jgi:hypothetical protein